MIRKILCLLWLTALAVALGAPGLNGAEPDSKIKDLQIRVLSLQNQLLQIEIQVRTAREALLQQPGIQKELESAQKELEKETAKGTTKIPTPPSVESKHDKR